jgi:hypothetical protein
LHAFAIIWFLSLGQVPPAFPHTPAKGSSAKTAFCQWLANLPEFCQGLAKSKNRAADGFANVWQIRAVFAEHWQNAGSKGSGFRVRGGDDA